MKFVDEVTIEVIAGKGGDGVASFRREKFIPKGGPNGGDGGRGGSIIVISDYNINTLVDFRYKRIFRAKNGENGRGSDQNGAAAENIILTVPIGTIIKDLETKDLIADLKNHGDKIILAKGGEGGLGNLHFKSSINRAPRQFTKGIEGETKKVQLELRVLADVGLLGLPNSGKSTLISKISNAKPKIAEYPFTTLYPNLGVVRISESNSFTVADIPGLITGASKGAGLGHLFLRHLTRAKILLHIIDISSINLENNNINKILQDYKDINKELNEYNNDLANKPRWLVLNKMDLIPHENINNLEKNIKNKLEWNNPIFTISSITKEGVNNLLYALQSYINKNKTSSK
ncbi:GTP-binding protein [Candidatus Kinetoplastibacterium desouzaii TCC079E]|uniref:GTPase Obg n=1 Tax=Candidatus Kinetoplastidibacterium desouzai TCC079E TaxID=1208919 RepID=M1LSU7_9PROT|nr:GTPase ObgE [Candidatus Kinetoplastibacterium desouzaii]AGF47181.1 GTP-binding protein [Candidatus Kinetoplastibacterium desouzaii TCC079E]